MRILLCFFCLLRIAYSDANAQSIDSIQISFGPHSCDDACQFAANGSYKVPAADRTTLLHFSGRLLIDPRMLTGTDDALHITAFPEQIAESPKYTFFSLHYPNADFRAYDAYYQYYKRLASHNDAMLDYPASFLEDTVQFSATDPRTHFTIVINQSYVKYDLPGSDQTGVVYKVSFNDSIPLYEIFRHQVDSLITAMETDYKRYRQATMQPVVNELLTPFYLSQTEVSNADYRAFVHWVRDSLSFVLLYKSLSNPLKLLNCTKQQQKQLDPNPTPAQRAQYLRQFGFNYRALDREKYPLYANPEYFPDIESIYLPINERFYVRREFDTRKFIYQSGAISPTPIYPDTLSWLRDSTFSPNDPLANLYFWHPAYDNYPVVGLSEMQMRAYCDWLQRRKNEALKQENEAYTVRVELPGLYHYELAAKMCANPAQVNTIDVQADLPFVIHRPAMDAMAFVSKCYPAPGPWPSSTEGQRKMLAWQLVNQTAPFYYLTGGVSEYCTVPTPVSAEGVPQMTVLGGNRFLGLVDPHENQLNTTFYRQSVPAGTGSSTVGFRTVLTVEPHR